MTPKRIDIHITCSKCQKPVESRVMNHDPANGAYIYDLSCHGATEQAVIPIPASGVHHHVAFAPPKAAEA